MSRPSIHAIGWSVSLWWPWKFHPGVSRRSPRRIATGSPLTTVQTPSPSTTNRKAFWLCRCSGAVSSPPRYWIAHHSVGVAYGRAREPGVRQADGPPLAAAPDGHELAGPLGEAEQRGPAPHVRHRLRRRRERHQVVALGPQRGQVRWSRSRRRAVRAPACPRCRPSRCMGAPPGGLVAIRWYANDIAGRVPRPAPPCPAPAPAPSQEPAEGTTQQREAPVMTRDLPLDGRTAVVTGAARGTAPPPRGGSPRRVPTSSSSMCPPRCSTSGTSCATPATARRRRSWTSPSRPPGPRPPSRAGPSSGHPQILVHNAYATTVASLEDTPLASWEHQLRVSLTSAYLGSRALLPDLTASGRGAIVMVSSVHARFGLPGRAAYASAKAGMTGLARQLAAEYAPAVRVNSVLPGPILHPTGTAPARQSSRAPPRRPPSDAWARRPRWPTHHLSLLRPGVVRHRGRASDVDGGWSITKDSA